jgi:hypothetical protein
MIGKKAPPFCIRRHSAIYFSVQAEHCLILRLTLFAETDEP